MAKVAQVIGGIALVALAIAGSVFIPGVGGYVLSATMQSIAFGIGSTLALRGVTSLIQRPASVKAAATTQRGVTSQDPVGPRRIPYGAVKLGGIVTFKSFTGAGYGGTGDNTIYMVVTMSGKRVHAITNLYLNGNYVHLDGGGDADDLYAGLVHAEYNLGTDTQSAFPGLVADSNGLWTAFHKQLRCAGAYLRIDIDKPPFSGSVPNATFDLDGCRVYDPREDVSRGGAQTFDDPETWVWTRNAVLIIADFLRDPTGYNAEYADILESLLIAGANLSDERVSLAGLTGFSGVGLDDLVGGGTYSGAVDPQVFNFKVSTEGTPDKFQWQEGDGDWSAEIDITGGFQTIADGVTAKFTATTGHTAGDMWTLRVGTEARYCIDGTYDTTEDPSSVLTDMAAAIAGTVYQVGGQWLIVPGAFRTPYPVPFTPDDFTEAFKVTITRSRKDLFNSVKGTFIPDHSAIQTDFPAYKGSKYITQDGESIYKDVSMRFVKSSSACMRIGKISVERNRRQKLISTSTKLLGYETQPGDVRNLLFDRYAWVEASSGSITLDVNAAAGTFTRPSGSFITDGFIVNQPVIITGMAKDGNNTIGVIKTVTALVITLKDNAGLEDETGAGSQGIDGKNTFEVIGVQFGIKDDNGKPVHTVAVTLAETDEHAYSWMGKEEVVPAINPDANVDLLDDQRQPPMPWLPGNTGPQTGDTFFNDPYDPSAASFGLDAIEYTASPDGKVDAVADVSGIMPVNSFSDISRPQVGVISTQNTGGHLVGGVTIYVDICGIDSDGRLTSPSFSVKIAIPLGTDTNTIDLSGIIWDGSNADWAVFAGTSPNQKSFQGRGSVSHPLLTITGPSTAPTVITIVGDSAYPALGMFLSSKGRPDNRFGSLRLKAKRVDHGGIWGSQVASVTAGSITVDKQGTDWSAYTNAFAGRFLALVGRVRSNPGYPSPNQGSVELVDYKVDSNDTAGVLTLVASQPDPSVTGQNLVAGDVLVMRAQVTNSGNDSVGDWIEDALFVNPFGASGLIAADELGRVIRWTKGANLGFTGLIIGGSGANPTYRLYVKAGTFPSPISNGDSFVIEEQAWGVGITDQTSTQNSEFNQVIHCVATLPNIQVSLLDFDALVLISAVTVSPDGLESADELNPFRMVWVYGRPAFALSPDTIPFSATPVFDTSLGNPLTIILRGDVTSSSIVGTPASGKLSLRFVQDTAGGHQFAWPPDVVSQGNEIGSLGGQVTRVNLEKVGSLWEIESFVS